MKKWSTTAKAGFMMLAILLVCMPLGACTTTAASTTAPVTTAADATAAAQATVAPTAAPTATAAEPVKFSVLWPYQSLDWTKAEIWQQLQQKANVQVEVIDNAGNYDQKESLLYASGSMPDFFSTAQNSEYEKNATAKFTMDELKQYMPLSYDAILKAMSNLSVNADTTWKRYLIDGKLFGIPQLWYEGQFGHGPTWRLDILKQLGYSQPPTTLAQMEEIFAKYKAAYPDKYAYGSNNDFARQFDIVYGAYGVVPVRWMYVDSKLVPGWTQPGDRKALETLSKWYKLGYINREFITTTDLADVKDFTNGITIVKEWCEYSQQAGLERIAAGAESGADANMAATMKINPTAELVAGAWPVADGVSKAACLVWKAFNGGTVGIAKKDGDDPDRLHTIMAAYDKLTADPDLVILSAYGIEGKTYEIVDNQVQWLGDYKDDKVRAAVGIGFIDQFGTYQPIKYSTPYADKYIQAAEQKYYLDADGIYNSSKLDKVPGGINDIFDEAGNDLNAKYQDLINAREALFAEIITGKQPITAFDDYVKRWNSEGGAEIEKAVNRMYLSLYQ